MLTAPGWVNHVDGLGQVDLESQQAERSYGDPPKTAARDVRPASTARSSPPRSSPPPETTLPVRALLVAVVVTLAVYWVAEEYAELLGEQADAGRLPTWPHIQTALAATWPMVSASFLPLLALVLTWLPGASAPAAANVGLAVAIVLLTIHGWSAGRASQLRGRQLFAPHPLLPCWDW